jgi:hypothetical protein
MKNNWNLKRKKLQIDPRNENPLTRKSLKT